MAIGVKTPEGAHVEPTKEEARQGQNIKGMVSVLVISLLLVGAAYGVLLAFFSGGETTIDRSPAADIVSETNSAAPATGPVAAPPQ